jgi:hypothetical protein
MTVIWIPCTTGRVLKIQADDLAYCCYGIVEGLVNRDERGKAACATYSQDGSRQQREGPR